MSKFKKINRTTTLIIIILIGLIALSAYMYRLSGPNLVYLQCLSIAALIISTIWIIVKLNQMRRDLAFDTTRKSGTILFRTQVLTLVTIAILVFGLIAVLKIDPTKDKFPIAFAICTGIISLVFSDIIKSITAYTHLTANGHVHINDWIILPKHGVDGMVKSVSMLSVKIENWDNSVSTIPTYTLLNEHLQNYQRILDVNDYGRKLCKTFIIDTSSIHTMNEEEVEKLRLNLQGMSQSTISIKDVTYPTINLQLYRKFIHHWLKNNEEITYNPRLLASLQEPTPEGVPLQIYVFLKASMKEKFELRQSEITEFVIMSMEWFGLRLYQRPSDYQISRLSSYSNENH